MQIDLRTVSIKPLRNTFDHLARRFGDKPASRYQEGTYDIQADANFQYRPTWDPDHDLHDPRRTRVAMKDWYALKDPRQFYYGAYTMARARMQDAAEANFEFFESRDLVSQLPEEVRLAVLELLVPLRHAAWGANMNNSGMCADGYGTAVTQPCMYHAMDDLGIAQYLTRIGLLLAGTEALDAGRRAWLEDGRWQPLRRLVEQTLVTGDWFELFVAQNLVLDGLLYPLVYDRFVDKRLTTRGGAGIAMLTAFMGDWHAETSKWVDAVVKTAAAESLENRELISGWGRAWQELAVDALAPLARRAFGEDGDAALASVADAFTARTVRLGLTA